MSDKDIFDSLCADAVARILALEERYVRAMLSRWDYGAWGQPAVVRQKRLAPIRFLDPRIITLESDIVGLGMEAEARGCMRAVVRISVDDVRDEVES